MKVSVIIPTKNRNEILEETILCLSHEQSYLKNEVEVIVVNDGAPIPETISNRYPNIKIIKNKGNGAGNARNTGAAHATGELFLFLDDDMLVGLDCIGRHIANHVKYSGSLISGTWEYSPFIKTESLLTSFGRYKIAHDYLPIQGKKENELSRGVFTSTSLATFNLSITRAAFLDLGGFHTDFPFAGCEDQEFTMRAAGKGFKLIVDNNIICLHNEKDRLSLDGWLMRQFTGVQGFVLLCELFPFRKTERLYQENTPVQPTDAVSLKMKKILKYLFSRSLVLIFVRSLTHSLETLRSGDKAIFRFYHILSGIYIYKGFRRAFFQLHK